MATTVLDVFDTAGSFWTDPKISLGKSGGVRTGSVPAVLGWQSGYQCLVLTKLPKVIRIHCISNEDAAVRVKRSSEKRCKLCRF